MDFMNLFRSFELLDESQQIHKVADMLENAGFTVLTRKSRKNLVNVIYTKPDVPYVFIVIYNPVQGYLGYTILDADIYQQVLADKPSRVLNYSIRHDGKYKVIFSEDKTNKILHRFVFSNLTRSMAIDHKSHNISINTREMLAVSDNSSNMKNVRYYCTVNEAKHQFNFTDSIKDTAVRNKLTQSGFRFIKGRVYSPIYKDENDTFTSARNIEKFLFGDNAYNPYIDFRNTFYAYVLCRCLGVCSLAQAMEYNRDYYVKYDKHLTKYYRLIG